MGTLIADGAHFHVELDGRRVVWSGATRQGDSADARLFAAALTAAADKLDRERADELASRHEHASDEPAKRPSSHLDHRYWFGTGHAAEHTAVSQTSIVKALQSGELKGQQRSFGGRWRIHRDDLDAWMGGTGGS